MFNSTYEFNVDVGDVKSVGNSIFPIPSFCTTCTVSSLFHRTMLMYTCQKNKILLISVVF